ncbi:hypothetical protein PO185_09540 [Limosilactobacillus mucosae]|uniref:hypothetical protein n=1 Tax=Limosilactobacillus mucosae TaxID=97478 RepID=UPI00233E92F9|nr:hypothetical protein [Limosilactobacillus mucosae]MDC2845887.1 hypothetical protein [Limosilactobacillus mucosae]
MATMATTLSMVLRMQLLIQSMPRTNYQFVAEVLNQCSESTRKLITDRYINGLTVWQAADSIGYGRTRYKELFSIACNEFAERYAARGHELRIFQ